MKPKCTTRQPQRINRYFLRQVAANNRGIKLVGDLIQEYGLSVVHAYMAFIQVPTRTNSKPQPHQFLRSSRTAFPQ